MSRENVEIVRLAYDVAYAERSVERVREKFADDFTWHNRGEFPGRHLFRVDEMPQLWADLDDTYSDFSLVPAEFVAEGEYVIVTIRMSARPRASNARVEGTIWHVWHVVDGKPREGWAYGDRREAFEAAGVPEPG